MTFEEMVQNLVNRENKDRFWFYEDEDVVVTLKDGSVIEGYAVDYHPFYASGTLEDEANEIHLGAENDDDVNEDEDIGELRVLPEGGTVNYVIKKKMIAEIRRKKELKSFFNRKQRSLLEEMGIDENEFITLDEYLMVIDKIAIKYHEAFKRREYDLSDQYNDMLLRFKGIEPSWVSMKDGWKAEPLRLKTYMMRPESDSSYSVLCFRKETVHELELTNEVYMQAVINKAKYMYENHMEKGANNSLYTLLRPLINWTHKSKAQDKNIYLTLNEVYEADLYKKYYPTNKKIVDMEPDYASYLAAEAHRQVSIGDPYSAMEYITAALAFNPVSARLVLDQADIQLLCQKPGEAYRQSVKALDYAFRPNDRARCFENIGDYYYAKGKYRNAVVCYAVSLWFFVTKSVQNKLKEISAKAPEAMDDITYQEAFDFAEEHGFDIDFDSSITWKLDGLADAYMKEKMYDVAIYYLEIIYGLTRDIKVKGKILFLEKML